MGYNRGYVRQLSPQTGTSIASSNTLSSNSPYYGQSDADAQIYNYVWDNYSYFDLDGDGIVSPTDAYMLLRALISYSSFNSSIAEIHLSANANATRTTGAAIWDWFENHRDNTTIDRGTYSPPDGSADEVIGTKGVYDLDADGSHTPLGDGMMAVRIFGGYSTYNTNPSLRVISSTSTFLEPHDGGPAVWNGSTWDYSGIEVIDDNRRGIFNTMNLNDSYVRQLSPQTVNATITDGTIAAASPYFGQSDADAQIYDYLWDRYWYFDFDGDGIVSPTDGEIFFRILLGSQFNGTLLDGLPISANATRVGADDEETEALIRDWYTANLTISTNRGTYDPPDGSPDIVVGYVDAYDIDASGSVTASGDGSMAMRVFGGYDSGAVTTTAQFLDPYDGGPAVWNGSTWDYGQANYPTEVSAGDIIYDSNLKELVIYDGFKWSVQAASEAWNASGGISWVATQTMPNGIDAFMKYHRFSWAGQHYLNVPSPKNVEFALIGGGGGGGSGRFMGGGGAGGITAGSGPVTTGDNTIIVGYGGYGWNPWSMTPDGQGGTNPVPASEADTYTGNPGGDSTAGGLTAYGGGCTAHYLSPIASNKHGGSGCGSPAHYGPYSATAYTGYGSGYPSPTQQGHPGGVGTNDAGYGGTPGTGNDKEIWFTGGGGGGAGSVGQGCPPNTAGIMDGGIGIPHSEFHNLNGSSSAPIYPGIQWSIPSSQGTGLPSYLADATVGNWPTFYQPHALPESSPTRTDRWFGSGGGGGQGRHTGSSNGSPYVMPSNYSAGGGGMGASGNHGTDGINGTGGGGGAGGFYLLSNYSAGDGGSGAVYVRYAQSDAKTYGSGGTESTHSLWRVHTFTSPGTFNLESVLNDVNGSLYVIVVAGGGGGGADGGGGGGGGGVIQHTLPAASILPSRSNGISITVGTGGGGGNSALNNPEEGIADSGTDSVFGACGDNPAKTALGGGGGGSNYNSGDNVHTGRSGGSGGGGGAGWNQWSYGGSGTSGQGNSGGTGNSGTNFRAGGGGGAGGAGTPAYSGEHGGVGLGIANLPSSVGTSGPDNSLRYFGGGGGGMRWSGAVSSGGYGGGGDGGLRSTTYGISGTHGTGGGGGGSSYGTTGGLTNFRGGDGIVIIKYLI